MKSWDGRRTNRETCLQWSKSSHKKKVFDDTTKKFFYRSKVAHDNANDMKFYVNGTINHSINGTQSDESHFTGESPNNTKLK